MWFCGGGFIWALGSAILAQGRAPSGRAAESGGETQGKERVLVALFPSAWLLRGHPCGASVIAARRS